MSGAKQEASTEPNAIAKLKDAMKLLPGRLENTNLRDFTSNTQIFTDAVSMASDSDAKSDHEKELISEARAIKGMVDALQSYWSARIYDGTYYGKYGYKSYRCYVLKPKLEAFNTWTKPKYSVAYNGTESNVFLIGKMEDCQPQETEMTTSIITRVTDALVDPEIRKKEMAQKKREDELAKMGPWLRYLEENPKLKKWIQANPTAGEKEKEKFLKKQTPKPAVTAGYFTPSQWDATPYRQIPKGQ